MITPYNCLFCKGVDLSLGFISKGVYKVQDYSLHHCNNCDSICFISEHESETDEDYVLEEWVNLENKVKERKTLRDQYVVDLNEQDILTPGYR